MNWIDEILLKICVQEENRTEWPENTWFFFLNKFNKEYKIPIHIFKIIASHYTIMIYEYDEGRLSSIDLRDLK